MGVAHPVDVALKVADLLVQIFGFDTSERVGAGGADEGLDVAVVKLAEPGLPAAPASR